MEPKKRWDGYRSFSYLEAGTDYRVFDLSPQIGRVEPFVYPLSAEDGARAERLLRECVCVSLHDHAGVMPADLTLNDAYIREGREAYGFEGLAASGLDAVFENFMDGTATITSKSGWKWTDVIHDLGMHLADVAHQSVVVVGATVDDIVGAHRTGKVALIPPWRARRRSRTSWTASTCSSGWACGCAAWPTASRTSSAVASAIPAMEGSRSSGAGRCRG